MDLLTPRRYANNTLLRNTQKQCTARSALGCLPFLSLTTKGSWIHFGDARQTFRQACDASTSHKYNNAIIITHNAHVYAAAAAAAATTTTTICGFSFTGLFFPEIIQVILVRHTFTHSITYLLAYSQTDNQTVTQQYSLTHSLIYLQTGRHTVIEQHTLTHSLTDRGWHSNNHLLTHL